MKTTVCFGCSIVALLLFLGFGTASALPRFALRGGDIDCRGCHLDPTGGRIRTDGGDNFAMAKLAMWPSEPKFSANIGEGIRIGVDMRSQFLYFSDYQSFTSNYSALGHTRSDTTLRASGGLEMALPIYVSAKLSDAVSAYVKVDPIVSPLISNSWEGYAIVHFVHSSGEFIESGSAIGDAYFKVGAFYPAFGVRFDDHTVYTRGGNASISGFGPAGMFWQPNYKDEGFEIGAELFDHAFITADVLNGNEASQGFGAIFKNDPFAPYALSLRGIISTGSLMDHTLSAEIGGSVYLHTVEHLPSADKLNDSMANTRLIAIHGGLHVGPFSILAESDMGHYIFHVLSGGHSDTARALAIEAAVDITKGLTGIVRFDDYHDGNTDGTETNINTRFMVGFQWFPVRFLEFRPEFRIARGTAPAPEDPTKLVDHTETTALLQTHIFF
ncbi:MAG TPA: hypothetical protein VG537_04905 [Candidatus Kapabacteria bacterium]|jgi:hypothetical protein|nr:hypothetical protein [Candidatus Kapabacteria bacterium]